MTELLYMQDFDVETCRARVLEVTDGGDGGCDVVLDATCFYPRGGGQDWDTGSIEGPAATFEVTEVRADEDSQVHHLGRFTRGRLAAGEEVKGVVDHARRLVNTRLHSAAHVIDMAVDGLGLDWVATKGQHYPHLSAVEYEGSWDPEQAEPLRERIETETNRLISGGSHNTISFVPVERMHEVCRHVPANIPSHKPARVVMYGESFGIPCGGTHVRNIGDVGRVAVPKLKQKKGVIRATYTVDGIASDG